MNHAVEEYPHSAIANWSGYVYQGKVAIYHSLKLILNGNLNFELQLDSTDDFAIYSNGKLESAHQVKGNKDKNRSSYKDAFEKSAKIEHDRASGITRYFHVSVELDNMDNYQSTNGEEVIIYPYDEKSYCGLNEIEIIIKKLIEKILIKNGISFENEFIHNKYCLITENINNQIHRIHGLNQVNNIPIRDAAYNNRIKAQNILNEIINKNPYGNKTYYAIDLKLRFQNHLEEKLSAIITNISQTEFDRWSFLLEFVTATEANEFKRLCQLIKPSEKFQTVQRNDIRRYTNLIQSIEINPIFNDLPHYLDQNNKFYVPTALDIDNKEDCKNDIMIQLNENEDLLSLLFEYNNLIASKSFQSFDFDTKVTKSTKFGLANFDTENDSNITKKLCIKVLTKEDAENILK